MFLQASLSVLHLYPNYSNKKAYIFYRSNNYNFIRSSAKNVMVISYSCWKRPQSCFSIPSNYEICNVRSLAFDILSLKDSWLCSTVILALDVWSLKRLSSGSISFWISILICECQIFILLRKFYMYFNLYGLILSVCYYVLRLYFYFLFY